MPYIAPEHRLELDGLIDQLAHGILTQAQKSPSDAAFAGLLNYACTRLALKIVRHRFGPMRYWLIALVTGVFKNIADEFYRRVAAPYEERQMAQSGDVDLYREYIKEIKMGSDPGGDCR
ncbi:MAG: hypothetical protein FJ134_05500 [Deltaproteobacteria bacterium]|nr:hypothetical protein [Deltaproteobacteria bacterium]